MTREQCAELAAQILEFLFGHTDDALEIATRQDLAGLLATMLYTKISGAMRTQNN